MFLAEEHGGGFGGDVLGAQSARLEIISWEVGKHGVAKFLVGQDLPEGRTLCHLDGSYRTTKQIQLALKRRHKSGTGDEANRAG